MEITCSTKIIHTLYDRMINKIGDKIKKAKKWQKRFDLLVLAVLLNEYETIYLEKHDWEIWIAKEDISLAISPHLMALYSMILQKTALPLL